MLEQATKYTLHVCVCIFLLQDGKTALMMASEKGKTECLMALNVNSNKVLRCVKNITCNICGSNIQVSCDHRCCVHYWVHNY